MGYVVRYGIRKPGMAYLVKQGQIAGNVIFVVTYWECSQVRDLQWGRSLVVSLTVG